MEPILILALFGISTLMISSGGDDDTTEPEDTQDEETPIVPIDTIMDETDSNNDGDESDGEGDDTPMMDGAAAFSEAQEMT